MPKKPVNSDQSVSREKLAALLNEDLGPRISSNNCLRSSDSQVLKGAEIYEISLTN